MEYHKNVWALLVSSTKVMLKGLMSKFNFADAYIHHSNAVPTDYNKNTNQLTNDLFYTHTRWLCKYVIKW